MENKAFIGISERAVATFDDFLLCRFHMFLMVYFHYKAVCLEKLLYRYFASAPNEYKIPADIEEYLVHDDHHLMKVLRNSDNRWAQMIMRNTIPKKIFETFGHSKNESLLNLENYLKEQNIDYIKCSSSGRLSKYYSNSEEGRTKFPLKVVRANSIGPKKAVYQDIDEATDLFAKFTDSHTVNRIHCEFERLTEVQQQELIRLASL